ncbi:transposase [Streptococcus pneumoniae]|nr:transposase [Streptococcus pneumoniae]
MHIHYNTNQTTLPLEISSFLPQDHLVFTIEKVVNTDEKEVNHLIKYAMFDKEQKRGYKQSARNLANWHYNDKEDSYTHPDGWYYRFHHTKYQKTQTDFQQEIKVYYADEPESAPQKGLYMNERYQNLKAKECQALLSPQGRQIFAQRKIDVEPVFGQIKACLGYKRCNLRGSLQMTGKKGFLFLNCHICMVTTTTCFLKERVESELLIFFYISPNRCLITV